ncbi:MAG: SiaB family protein kinase [Cytophagaceae bacterium]|nr:SiaB family protein kinase [Cytophagaceae bacterium]MDW8456196.1 SiaB family protein kinase [Cytophagaceae bacterium]
MKYIYEIQKIMSSKNLMLVYEGEFTQEITKSVLSMAERNLETKGEEMTIKRKVFNVMVECLQNICKHADSHDNEHEKEAVFMIGKEDNNYIITSGNFISNDNVESLKEKLDHINSLDKEGLKNLYKELIKNNELSDRGGAGLGFVDIARKSGSKLEYDFERINDNISFFSFKTSIPITKE